MSLFIGGIVLLLPRILFLLPDTDENSSIRRSPSFYNLCLGIQGRFPIKTLAFVHFSVQQYKFWVWYRIVPRIVIVSWYNVHEMYRLWLFSRHTNSAMLSLLLFHWRKTWSICLFQSSGLVVLRAILPFFYFCYENIGKSYFAVKKVLNSWIT